MTPDEDAKANRQGSFLLLFSAKRTGVLSIWTDKLPQNWADLRKCERKKELVAKCTRFKHKCFGMMAICNRKAEKQKQILIKCRREQNVCTRGVETLAW